jgi:hypothetical protein
MGSPALNELLSHQILIPVTVWGRIISMFIMFAGLALVGALTSVLASLLVGPPSFFNPEQPPGALDSQPVDQEISEIKNDLAALRRMLEEMSRDCNSSPHE